MTAALDLPGASVTVAELQALRDLVASGGKGAGPGTVLVADVRPSMLCGRTRAFRSVAAAEVLAMVGWQALGAGGHIGLMTVGTGSAVIVPLGVAGDGACAMDEVIAGLVRAHEAALAHALAGQLDDVPLERGLSDLESIAPEGATIVIASGFSVPGAGLAARLAGLARRGPLKLVHVVDGARAAGGAEKELFGQPVQAIDASAQPRDTAAHLAALTAGPDVTRLAADLSGAAPGGQVRP
ncbi:hypothetical protein GCM10011415_31060 [Salipiger pallidus]|uniref:DUF58 domain-containing protein n=1 Tax=Salipiger pallidus TaxID=1775170 RepID=A0A8J3EHK9_9RHOB|nr:hypothetical protein [Salipiger pallidus]GGG79611.1 hypothetical protein GCM10011415_31060 [Salipiger pallidus]